jgi:hypothetical protein
MPRQETVLQVFLASPGDVSAERRAVKEVIDELNQTWSNTLGLRLELITWETHTRPAFGEDAQEVINAQIGDTYDLFLGMMWGRFGTPTARAGSGTQEEFENALERFKAKRGNLQIMIYFKHADMPMESIDPEQIRLIRDFKHRVAGEGGLYWNFENTDEFAGFLRLHLSKYVQDWTERTRGGQASNDAEPVTVGTSSTGEFEEDEGLFDVLDTVAEELEALGQNQERMTDALQDLTGKLEQRTREMERASSKEGRDSIRALQRVTNRAADDLEHFVRVMRPEIASFGPQFAEILRLTGMAASLVIENNPKQVNEQLYQLADSVQQTAEAVGGNGVAATNLADIIRSGPKMSITYNRARRSAVELLEVVAKEFTQASTAGMEAATAIRNMGQ